MLTRKGFTLIEVLIVVIILGILATIAIPQFARMTRKARLAEAWTNLAAIRTGESVYYMEESAYTTNIGQLDAGEATSTNFTYSVNVSGSTFNAASAGSTTATNGITAWMTDTGASDSNY